MEFTLVEQVECSLKWIAFDDIDEVCAFDYPRTNYLCARFKRKSAIKIQLTCETPLKHIWVSKSHVPERYCIIDEFTSLRVRW